MRVLSFIPALLLAAASFVAAAPTPDNSCTPSGGSGSPSGGSGSSGNGGSSGGSGGGDSAAVVAIVQVIAKVSADLQPYPAKLGGMTSGCTPQDLSNVLVEVTGIVNTGITNIKAAATVDLTVVDMTTILASIQTLIGDVTAIINLTIQLCGLIGVSACVSIGATISAFLNVFVDLTTCLGVYAVGSSANVLVTLFASVNAIVKVCLSLFVNVSVSL